MADGTGLFLLSNCDGHALVWEGDLGPSGCFLVRASLIAANLPLCQRKNENNGDNPFPFEMCVSIFKIVLSCIYMISSGRSPLCSVKLCIIVISFLYTFFFLNVTFS